MELRNEKGQTLVEYILLLAVAISLVMTFYNSDLYKRLFGTGGKMGQSIKDSSEFSYRHAYGNRSGETADEYPADAKSDPARHPSYHEPGKGTRFFGPSEKYP